LELAQMADKQECARVLIDAIGIHRLYYWYLLFVSESHHKKSRQLNEGELVIFDYSNKYANLWSWLISRSYSTLYWWKLSSCRKYTQTNWCTVDQYRIERCIIGRLFGTLSVNCSIVLS
jgi:hypothetical protein